MAKKSSSPSPVADSWLGRSFVFYGSYHNDVVNQRIHIVFVWAILWTAFTMLSYTPSFDSTLMINVQGIEFVPNWNLVACAVYFFWYLVAEPGGFAGYICCALVLVGYLLSTWLFSFHDDTSRKLLFTWALRVHILSWVAQFIGHGVFEGRSPALFSNLFQAFAMAPLFVVMEVLFSVGYRPDFKDACQIEIDKQLKLWGRPGMKKVKAT